MDKTYKIEISSRTIVFAVFLLLGLQLLWIVKELIFSLLIAFILMSAFNPWITALKKRRIPRGISAVVIFVTLIFTIGYFFSWIIPPIVQETTLLFLNLPSLARNINPDISQYFALENLNRNLPSITNNAFFFLREVFSNVIFVISTLFFSLYLLIEEDVIKKFIVRFARKNHANKVIELINKAEKRMRSWFWGQAILMLVIGTLTFIGLSLIGVKYALPLAIMAGLFEVVPILGPILSAIPAFLVAAGSSYFLGLATVALYFIIQQVENQIIVPLVMRKAVGLNPIVTLTALIVGGKLLGFLGVVLAIPLTLLVEVVVTEFYSQR
jgi:predicted PurR-regulated permease PerM